MKTKKRFFSLLLAVCLVVGLLPTTALAAGADTGKAIQLGTSGIAGYDSAAGYDYIYFGNWTAPDTYTTSGPIKWRVLDDQTNTGETGLFLLSDGLLGTGYYDGDVYFDNTNPYSNTWQGSDAQMWCNTFASSNLDSRELAAILETTKSDDAFISSTYNVPFAASENILNGDKVFFLSAEEAENSAYGFTDDNARIANYGNSAGVWWLRSPNTYTTLGAGAVLGGGYVSYSSVSIDWAARPAFNLDLNSVLFTSAAVGGKIPAAGSGGNQGGEAADAIFEIGDYTGSEWKLTLLDNSRSSFTVDASEAETSAEVGYSGWSIPIAYSGAQTGANEYVSALLCDSSGNVLYYGNIAQNSASGEVKVNIPSGLAAGNYTLKVFSEQCNGDFKTDYASAFQDISLAVTLPAETTPQAVFTATGDKGGTLSNVKTGMKYSTDGGANWKDITGTTVDLTGVTAANDVKVYKPGNGATTGDSAVQTIEITQADKPTVSGADCTTSEQNDGKITDVNSTMEYKLSTASVWTEITDTEVTGLSNGIYDVRVKANGTVLASETVTVTIGKHTCVAQGEWLHDETNHWKLCTCGVIVDQAAHSGGTATCTEKAICDTCDEEYGKIDASNHTNLVKTEAKPATQSETGNIEYWYCDGCGKYFSDESGTKEISLEDTVIPKLTENPSDGTTDDTQKSQTDANAATGDDSDITLWIAVMLAAGAAMTGTVLYGRRKNLSR